MTGGISVFVPMFNEEANAKATLTSVVKMLRSVTKNFEVIVVDDGSRDRTAEIVRTFSDREPRVWMVRHEVNRGYGAALRTGFNCATKEIVFYTDADLPIDFDVLKKVMPLMEQHPVVIGYRSKREGIKRWCLSKIYNTLLRLLFGLRVKDVNFSFKLFRKSVVDQFKRKLRAGSVFIDGEILIWLKRLEIPIHEHPIEYHPRKSGVSTLGSLGQAIYTLREISQFALKKN